MALPTIRALAICVFAYAGKILVSVAHDPIKNLTFGRPLGGGIEFGETGEETIHRELIEEIGAQVSGLRYLGTLESIFTYLGTPGHELVRVYDGELVDRALYEREFIMGMETDGQPFRAEWRTLDSFGPELPLFPVGLMELLRNKEVGIAV